jgi:opine dehydrogenase
VQLVNAGHEVTFWARSAATIHDHIKSGGVHYEGQLGEGFAAPSLITSDLLLAVQGAEVAVIALPTYSHSPMAAMLAAVKWPSSKLVILNPGHTGGALDFTESFRRADGAAPPAVEFSTLTYVARKHRPDGVRITGVAKQVRSAILGGSKQYLDIASKLFPSARPVRDVIASGLSNVNMMLHPPGAVLGAAWVEATKGSFTFYCDAMTPGVARVMQALDSERRAVAASFDLSLPNLIEEMKAIGTVEDSVTNVHDYRSAIAGGEANSRIMAPESFENRYYREDFGHGLLPFLELAAIAGVETPTAEALFNLASAATGVDYRVGGRTAQLMGIAGLSKEELCKKVAVA